jgi:hypothetical protein
MVDILTWSTWTCEKSFGVRGVTAVVVGVNCRHWRVADQFLIDLARFETANCPVLVLVAKLWTSRQIVWASRHLVWARRNHVLLGIAVGYRERYLVLAAVGCRNRFVFRLHHWCALAGWYYFVGCGHFGLGLFCGWCSGFCKGELGVMESGFGVVGLQSYVGLKLLTIQYSKSYPWLLVHQTRIGQLCINTYPGPSRVPFFHQNLTML